MVFEVKNSAIKGKGCFATQTISKGNLITKIKWKMYSREEINKEIYLNIIRDDDPLQIKENIFIKIKGQALFFNHSCNPNSGIVGENSLYSIRDINVGDEITFDYSTTVGTNIINWSMECSCKSLNCRKKIGNIKTIPKEILQKYLELNIVSKFIKKQLKI